jgi:RimJ/RimL family protein N-acetyltransferase
MHAIETPRLLLREMTADDAPFILALLNEPSFHRYIGDRGVRTAADAVTYIANGPQASYAKFGFGLWLVVAKDSGAPMGMCGVLKRDALEHPDIGFAFRPEFWGAGYAREAAAASLAHGRRACGLTRIDAIVQADNERSLHLLATLGFRPAGNVKLTPAGEELLLLASEGVAGAAG